MDAKDALYKHLLDHHASECMPPTVLIPYDCDREVDLPDFDQNPTPDSKPVTLLKAPLGSGGDSLYYVTSKADVLSIIKAHRKKAESTDGFLDALRDDHRGAIPSWSLQKIIPSVVLRNNRKCQVRAYIIYCDSELYLYSDYEVRQPMWIKLDNGSEGVGGNASSTDKVAPTLQADLNFCTDCKDGAKPYNYRRSKTHTERMMISEADGMLGTQATYDKITHVMLSAFRALKPKILSESLHPDEADRRIFQSQTESNTQVNSACNSESFPDCLKTTPYKQKIAELAIIGADLIIEQETMQPYIVEINNNPAMPAPTKTMTDLYRDHLMKFVASVIAVGIRAGKGEPQLSANEGIVALESCSRLKLIK